MKWLMHQNCDQANCWVAGMHLNASLAQDRMSWSWKVTRLGDNKRPGNLLASGREPELDAALVAAERTAATLSKKVRLAMAWFNWGWYLTAPALGLASLLMVVGLYVLFVHGLSTAFLFGVGAGSVVAQNLIAFFLVAYMLAILMPNVFAKSGSNQRERDLSLLAVVFAMGALLLVPVLGRSIAGPVTPLHVSSLAEYQIGSENAGFLLALAVWFALIQLFFRLGRLLAGYGINWLDRTVVRNGSFITGGEKQGKV